MKTIDNLRNSIIDKLLTISNREYLYALDKLIKESEVGEDKIQLTKEQMQMLQVSEEDIKYGRVISQSQLDKEDLEWLKGL